MSDYSAFAFCDNTFFCISNCNGDCHYILGTMSSTKSWLISVSRHGRKWTKPPVCINYKSHIPDLKAGFITIFIYLFTHLFIYFFYLFLFFIIFFAKIWGHDGKAAHLDGSHAKCKIGDRCLVTTIWVILSLLRWKICCHSRIVKYPLALGKKRNIKGLEGIHLISLVIHEVRWCLIYTLGRQQ